MENGVRKESKKTYFLYTMTLIVVLTVIAIGATYAYYKLNNRIEFDTSALNTSLECVNLTLSTEQSIGLSYKYPIKDETAIVESEDVRPVKFTITNNCDNAIRYTIALSTMFKSAVTCKINEEDKTGRDCYIDENKIRYYILQNGDELNDPDYLSSLSVLDTNSSAYQELIGNGSGSLSNKYEGQGYSLKNAYSISSNNLLNDGESVDYTMFLWVDYYEGDSARYTGDEVHPELYNGTTKNQKFAATVSFTIDAEEESSNEVVLANYIKQLANNSNSGVVRDVHTVAEADSQIKNKNAIDYRYIGPSDSVNNYVKLTNADDSETLYRIIGAFKVPKIIDNEGVLEASETDYEWRVKLIKAESYGDRYWSGSESMTNNNYNNSTLLNSSGELNTTYWNTLSSTTQGLIDPVVWYLGGVATDTDDTSVPTFYEMERSNNAQYDDNPKSAINKIGLMYPSDYGYATNGGILGRSTCLDSEHQLYNWNSYSDCYNNSWLFNALNEWTISPCSSDNTKTWSLQANGSLNNNLVYGQMFSMSPTFYLKSNVKVNKSHAGTNIDPYTLSL